MVSSQKRIFISHSHADNAFVAQLSQDLRNVLDDEQAVWYDVVGLVGGESWWDEIIHQLITRDIFFLILSPDAMKSDWVRREINMALNQNKHILPLYYRRCKVRADLETIQMISFLAPKSYQEAFQEILVALAALGLPVNRAEKTIQARKQVKLSPVKQKTKEQWTEESEKLIELGHYEEALAAADQVIYLDPNFVDAYFKRGAALYALKRYEEALAAFEQATRLAPNFFVAYMSRGLALLSLKRYGEAVSAFDQAIRLDPNDARSYFEKGVALDNLEQYGESIAAYEQAIRLDPDYAKAYFNKGWALYGLKRYGEAISAFDQAIRLNPNDIEAYINKGNVLYNLERYQEALSAYEQAIRLDPNYALAYYMKSDALEKFGRHQEAQQAREKAKQLGYSG